MEHLNGDQLAELQKVVGKFAFRANDYYLSLIDWNDPHDPIRRVVIPDVRELDEWGRLDPSNEESYLVMPGLQHKYDSVALLLVTNMCDGVCRYCFRKRIFMDSRRECLQDWAAAYAYIREHHEITNVLLTGGDPLMLPASEIDEILSKLRRIEHVQVIRLGTRVPTYNPYRVVTDKVLLETIKRHITNDKKIYVMTHFVHPRELTDIAVEGLNVLQKAGAMLANQTPLIRGVNDDPQVLAMLLDKLSFVGAIPYYIFQCRPAVGNKPYTVPVEEAYKIVEQAKAQVSGLAKRVRFTMSHGSGKIEIIGKTRDYVYFKQHRASVNEDSCRFMVFKSNPKAYWLDDYDEFVEDYRIV